jgi:dolichyl-phosphate-mannose-protein mannosyltransferase
MKLNLLKSNKNVIALLIILVLSFYFIYLDYGYPKERFWDECFYISAAEKYIHGIFFMEAHPPLGKLFMALGEIIFNKNKEVDKLIFLIKDNVRSPPDDYSYEGIRFFPVLFSTLTPILFFLIILIISKNTIVSFLFSLIYLFNNGFIVHFRGALLEGIQIFFVLLTLLIFVIAFESEKNNKIIYFILGILVGCAILIKINGAILLLLFPMLWIKQNFNNLKNFFSFKKTKKQIKIKNFKKLFIDILINSIIAIIGLLFITVIVWQIHFSISKNVINVRYYQVSDEYKEIIANNKTGNILYFKIMLKDNINYMIKYSNRVQKLKTSTDKRVSYPYEWVVGAKSIAYRWEKTSNHTRYLYLQVNPAIWFLGIISIIIALIIIIKDLFFKKIKNTKYFSYILVFTLLYLFYMIAMLNVKRQIYLPHYFVGLTFALILPSILFIYIFEKQIIQKNWKIYIPLIILLIIVILFFWFYSPFTYYQPLTDDEFMKRVLFDFWHLKMS